MKNWIKIIIKLVISIILAFCLYELLDISQFCLSVVEGSEMPGGCQTYVGLFDSNLPMGSMTGILALLLLISILTVWLIGWIIYILSKPKKKTL